MKNNQTNTTILLVVLLVLLILVKFIPESNGYITFISFILVIAISYNAILLMFTKNCTYTEFKALAKSNKIKNATSNYVSEINKVIDQSIENKKTPLTDQPKEEKE